MKSARFSCFISTKPGICQQNLARRLNINLNKYQDRYSHAAAYPQSDGQTDVAKTTGELFATYRRESAKKMDVFRNTHITRLKA
jgi:hypothetical protein